MSNRRQTRYTNSKVNTCAINSSERKGKKVSDWYTLYWVF